MLLQTLLIWPIKPIEQSQRVWFDSPGESQLKIGKREVFAEARLNPEMLHTRTVGHHKKDLLVQSSLPLGFGHGA